MINDIYLFALLSCLYICPRNEFGLVPAVYPSAVWRGIGADPPMQSLTLLSLLSQIQRQHLQHFTTSTCVEKPLATHAVRSSYT